ncbi:MAG TPA: lysine-sensitive aspartokinase 3 [Gemmatales bacterium]|nr:lysine-sensitive aspartokinase 3 [Gemmatales bacterium]
MIVMKFGGSSVADAGCLRAVAELVQAHQQRAPLVVLSAMGKTTNALFEAAQAAVTGSLDAALAVYGRIVQHHRRAAAELFADRPPQALLDTLAAHFQELELLLRGVALLRELSPRSMDAIASLGERLSTHLFAALAGATWVDARTILRTDNRFGEAQPDPPVVQEQARQLLAPLLGPGRLVVTQGYIGATAAGLTTTLGRGGSDFSASLFGAALGAEEVQIWTDVEGVMTCDPRLVPTAHPIAQLSFEEAAELAAFGAKVLHPATIQPAVEARIPVTVRHTGRPVGAYTTITAHGDSGRSVAAIAAKAPLSVLTVASARMLDQSGYLARLFGVFGRHGVSVDSVATAETSVSLTVDADAELEPLLAELRAFAAVSVARERGLVAVVGARLKHTRGRAARLFGVVRDINIERIPMGANEINLSLIVRAEDAPGCLKRLHAALFENPAGGNP